ncbi:MAG: ABC transporter ATP-binding protein [Dehalococcoidales bacterium]|nr:ABC transporter ATP-binding protein [Dehalococcoidales bacterium]
MAIIKTENLTKKFRDLVAVDNVSMEIADGECFGLLGPNGAGKTSLIRMITAISPVTAGQVWVDGQDLARHSRRVKALLGVVPQTENLDPDLTVLQNLLTFARYFEIPRKEAMRRSLEALRLFQLEEKRGSRIKALSGGMKRRLLIARGLINQPKILILDEPTVGLDPQSRHLLWQKLRELKAQGITQLLCTQNMEEAALLCDRVAIMHLGKIVVVDVPHNLILKYVGEKLWEIEPSSPAEREQIIRELKNHHVEFEEVGLAIRAFHVDNDELAHKLLVRPRQGTLEDVFFRLTSESLVE